MPVLSVHLPTARAQRLNLAALKRGIEASTIDTDGGQTFIDLIGPAEKIIDTIRETGSVTVIEGMDSVPHVEPVFTMVGRVGRED